MIQDSPLSSDAAHLLNSCYTHLFRRGSKKVSPSSEPNLAGTHLWRSSYRPQYTIWNLDFSGLITPPEI
ncbi:hypothetical protein FA13DRAFT_1732806 [Coprinellus micaceus]|uniref:Uncharacterized protein n=1 Tax=Coprinellus micaceus TaxID=71717 RepID=A0A4Y7TB20_COPMI|nr:hypothetical protein FA13DRAFT_1732806 [Coprinellus micaceus]